MRHAIPFLLAVGVGALAGCGKDEAAAAAKVLGCTVRPVEGGYELQCPDAPAVLVANGKNGQDGANGADGKNGHASVIAQTPAGAACPSGGVTILTAMDVNDNLVLDPNDGDLQSATLCGGTDAPVTPFMPVGIVDPCGTTPGMYNEVFLRLSNGELLASMSDDPQGRNTRFSMLQPGCFMTTDGDRCSFCIDDQFRLYDEHRGG